MHFNELKRLLGISSNVLAKKLKQLEQEGLVTRRAVFEDSPLRVEYKITPLAKELDAIFIGLDKWIAKWESRNKLDQLQIYVCDNNIAAIQLHSNQKHILLISILYKGSIEKKSAKIIMINVYVILCFIESYYYTLNLDT